MGVRNTGRSGCVGFYEVLVGVWVVPKGLVQRVSEFLLYPALDRVMGPQVLMDFPRGQFLVEPGWPRADLYD